MSPVICLTQNLACSPDSAPRQTSTRSERATALAPMILEPATTPATSQLDCWTGRLYHLVTYPAVSKTEARWSSGSHIREHEVAPRRLSQKREAAVGSLFEILEVSTGRGSSDSV